MILRDVWLVTLCLAGAVLVGLCAERALPQSSPDPRGQLQQYVAQLQKNPGDQELREKIIKLALTLKPAPAIPEEARKHFVVGTTLAKDAKSPSDCQDAGEELNKALLMAPWWGEAYWNLSGALLCAEKYEEAKLALRFFLDTNPKPDDARAAQDRTYTLEAKGKEKERQARAQQQAPPPADKRLQEQADFIKSLDGACYSSGGSTQQIYLFIRQHRYGGQHGRKGSGLSPSLSAPCPTTAASAIQASKLTTDLGGLCSVTRSVTTVVP